MDFKWNVIVSYINYILLYYYGLLSAVSGLEVHHPALAMSIELDEDDIIWKVNGSFD
jgi:hypothetical protein